MKQQHVCEWRHGQGGPGCACHACFHDPSSAARAPKCLKCGIQDHDLVQLVETSQYVWAPICQACTVTLPVADTVTGAVLTLERFR